MAELNVPDLLFLINQQIKSRQNLRDSLSKATALLHVSLENDILQNPRLMLYFYLWSILDIVEQSQNLNEYALNELINIEQQSI